MQFVNNIREWREARGFTQEELGEIIGSSKQYISGLERRKKPPSIRAIEKLCNILNVTPNDLLLSADDDSARNRVTVANASSIATDGGIAACGDSAENTRA